MDCIILKLLNQDNQVQDCIQSDFAALSNLSKKLDGLDGFGRTLPDYVVYEILQKSGVELNMTSVIGKEIKYLT
ncbi:hypothetical protein T4C_13478 [Trichinella pseudospiralis]|uniref:Uncharacterized protein n=1 Tax=Trichinella pseudospiralis TaxID=6337 RepID=A0A0V1GLM8_TRIPS|nr:hypothetical protein T4C_13478 [Trichinella pseudospiralis]